MAVAANFIFYAVKAVLFGAIAYAGIVMGKKYKDKKDLQKSN